MSWAPAEVILVSSVFSQIVAKAETRKHHSGETAAIERIGEGLLEETDVLTPIQKARPGALNLPHGIQISQPPLG